MELGLLLTLCSLGGAFWIPALVMIIIRMRRKMTCTSETKALVTNIKIRHSSDGNSYHPIYEYDVDGVHYSGLGAYISRRVPNVGTTIVIMYNPHNPNKSYIAGYDNKALKILSIIFLAIGCVPILICICIAFLG